MPTAAPYRRLLAGVALVAALLAGSAGASGTRTEVLTAKVVLRDPWVADPTVVERPVGGDYERFVRAQAVWWRSRELAARAAPAAGVDAALLSTATRVTVADGATSLTVRVEGPSAAAARARFDALVLAYRDLRRAAVGRAGDAQLAELVELQRQRPWDGSLVQLERDLRLAQQRYGDGVALAEVESVRPLVGPAGIVLRALLGAMAATAAGLSVVWVGARYRTRRELVAPFGRGVVLPGIGSVAHLERLRRTTSAEQAGYERAAAALLHTLAARPPRLGGSGRAVVVSGFGPGVLTAAALLATGARGLGCRAEVIVVDEASLGDAFDALDGLDRRDAELVLLACPPVAESSLALRLGEVVDAVMIVVPRRRPPREVRAAVAMFRRVDTAVLVGLSTVPGR